MTNLISTLKKNTARNNHTENYLLLAEHYKLKNLATIFNCILDIQEVENCLPQQLSEYRFANYQKLLSEIKGIVTEQEYQSIYNTL